MYELFSFLSHYHHFPLPPWVWLLCFCLLPGQGNPSSQNVSEKPIGQLYYGRVGGLVLLGFGLVHTSNVFTLPLLYKGTMMSEETTSLTNKDTVFLDDQLYTDGEQL